jgi:hypothetical protein
MIPMVFHVLIFPCIAVFASAWPSALSGLVAVSGVGTITTLATSLFFLAGFAFLGVQTARDAENKMLSRQAFLLFWFLGELFLVGATTRAIFDRYFLPVLPSIVLMAALSLASLDQRLRLNETGRNLLRMIALPLFLLSQASAALAFYPEFYERAWPDPSNLSMFGTVQQSILRPFGQLSILLFLAAVACIIAVQSGLGLSQGSSSHAGDSKQRHS